MSKSNPKPAPKALVYFDYAECSKYLEQLYGYNERDFDHKYAKPVKKGAQYQDFWDFVLERADIRGSGALFVMRDEWGELASAEWQKTILNYYLDAFGTGEPGEREIQFIVHW